MNCTHPIYATINRLSDGSNRVKILPKRVDQYSMEVLEQKYGHDHIIALPCGKCLACKVNYAKNWASRCVLEASCWKYNWFVTLTYDEDHIGNNELDRRDMQLFLMRLREKLGAGIRFFGCGEYGSKTHRKHYHLILFNCDLPDIKCLGKAPKGGYYYDSKILRETWSKGLVNVGDVTMESCNYVSRYCIKKVFGVDDKEFVAMSRRPGIGQKFFEDHYKEIYDEDRIYFKFGNSLYQSPSRYFDKLFSNIDPLRFAEIKDKRVSSADLSLASELLARGCLHKEDLYEIHEELSKRKEKRGL